MISMRVQQDLRLLPLGSASWYASAPISEKTNEELREFARIELRKENPTGDRDQLRHDLEGLREMVWRVVTPRLGQVFVIIMSPTSRKSRIRSHKALFWGTPAKKSEFREVEVDLGEQSYFVGALKLDPANHEWGLLKALWPYYAFLYVASMCDIDAVVNQLFPQLPSLMCRRTIPFFEFPRLVPALINHDEAIFHLDVDGSAERWSELRIYTKSSSVPYWKQAFDTQMEDAERAGHFEVGMEGPKAGVASYPASPVNAGRVSWPGKIQGDDT